jgi:quercetin dioxygenase-like cupin family protein
MKDLHTHVATIVAVSALACLFSSSVRSQALAGSERAKPVADNPGISSMVVTDQAQFRVLRNYAEPGATRRMHSHDDVSYHVFVLVTGALTLTVDGEAPVPVTPGETLQLPAGAKHAFTNTGTVTATMVEVFGKK